jgi:hypothetical protein
MAVGANPSLTSLRVPWVYAGHNWPMYIRLDRDHQALAVALGFLSQAWAGFCSYRACGRDALDVNCQLCPDRETAVRFPPAFRH